MNEFIEGDAGKLEVMVTHPKEETRAVVGIICHPDPRFEGSMNNKVVTTLARAFERVGIPTVRFNFRGVGKSEGEYGDVLGEQEDLLAVITWVKQVLPTHALCLAGFSFGSFIAASVANQMSEVKHLISIAPPVHHYDFTQLTQIACPWLVVQGNQDEVVPFKEVLHWAEQPPSPLCFVVMEGVGHFFHGKLIELRNIVEQELSSNLL